METVAAEKVTVARRGDDLDDVDVDRRLHPQRPGDDRTVTVLQRFFGGNAAFAHEFTDNRVVFGELFEAGGGQAVRAGIADVRDAQQRLVSIAQECDGRDRRSHSAEFGVVCRVLEDRAVGVQDC